MALKIVSSIGLLLFAGFALCLAADNSTACDKSKCPDYLFSHYDGKGCVPTLKDGDCCPTSFNCSAFYAKLEEGTCEYKGKGYGQGDKIETTNPCHKCSCGPNPSINCAITDCFQERPDPSCVPLFDHNSCCPKAFKCIKEDGKSEGTTCKYDDKVFVEGQIMIMKENPCMQCICDSSFKGPDSPSCRKLECNFPGHGQRLKAGCIPVYFEGQCCYVDWHCPPPTEDEKPVPPPSENPETCTFGSLTIERGDKLELGDPCVTCSCAFPPDLTCVRKRCPGPPPNTDVTRCQPVPREGQCCPEFICRGEGQGQGPAQEGQGN